MSKHYAGDPASFPPDYTIPDDGEPQDAACLDIPFEALGDRTVWLKERISGAKSAPVQFFAGSPTEWTAGPSDTRIRLEGYGGGGGGGGGAKGTKYEEFPTYTHASSGAGGAGALLQRKTVTVTPSMVYEAVVGDGGPGGAKGTSATSGGNAGNGGNGGDTIFREKVSGTVLARFKGGRGGRRGLNDFRNVGEGTFYVIPGGAPTDMGASRDVGGFSNTDRSFCLGPGFGGDGVANIIEGGPISSLRAGAGSIEGAAGGAGGAAGSNGSSYPAGAGGGGGGAGPGGQGLDGRDGGNANDGGVGADAPSWSLIYGGNIGAGGGGGGAGGGGATGGGNGSAGMTGYGGSLSLQVVL